MPLETLARILYYIVVTIKIKNTMDKEKIQEMLDAANKEFNENQSGIIAEIYSLETMLIVIEIEWGDWKH